MVTLPWLILFPPIAAAFSIALLTRRSRPASAALAIGALAVSLLSALALLFHSLGHPENPLMEISIPWIQLPGLSLEFGFLLDRLSILMSLVVTGVGLMIFIYSVGYMAHEPGLPRYFAFLSLFAFSMLGIVLANNFISLFIFWELVGASSYLLIGYWYDRPKAAEAGKKAFLVNRIADFGFLIGILMLWSFSGTGSETRTLNFLELARRLESLSAQGILLPATLAATGALLFCGVIGKSAQFPLHVWLPDAMEGPTPVSALIHAATMVAAGVYLLCRISFLLAPIPQVMEMIAGIGGFTAVFAASLALVENDIKRVLAYSTLSQLGYMVMALGLGGVTAGMFHLTTHAFFKAMLFMGAGCVIHSLETNDIRQMGGLYRTMPATTRIFGIGALALCGIFPFAGFWSKDEILALAFAHHRILWIVGTATAGMTAFYMGRLFCVVFLGEPRRNERHSHEAPALMIWPLIPLAILSVIGGFIGIPSFLHEAGGTHVEFNFLVAVISNGAAFGGLLLAYGIYVKGLAPARWLKALLGPLNVLLTRKFFVDEAYGWINRNVQQRTAVGLNLFERTVIIGLWANGIAKTTGAAGAILRRAQTGKVQTYALTLLIGLTLLIYLSGRWAP
ncbi:MAG: NADH-quinone oxidoreductase subunit L [Candidatus Omnitrophica bacterium]|nr:NADH-quinone oxidoreductase subunit L [Candidatus Omnitrophota bacterium]